MIKIDEPFTCLKCKMPVKKHPDGSCRNHCPYCLFSMHVDLETPGDRLSECKGLMRPVRIELNKKKGVRIFHECVQCGHTIFNRSASDDNWNLICELSRVPSDELD
ncbi:RNHCP domain-containing protein [Candidatus Peregrinibacteria bacterium]|nr:MAG: RNHCP domain-containing protein [Candidatus Peregrinibacteria bacterium]